MAKLSLREAANLFEVSRPTLTKALNSGKLSGARDGKGQWKVDHSELARVYHPRKTVAKIEQGEHPKDLVNFTTPNTPLIEANTLGEIENLRARLALAEARAEAAETLAQERAERIEDLRRMLPAPKDAPKLYQGRRWWPWTGG